jgi:hypothetical protein
MQKFGKNRLLIVALVILCALFALTACAPKTEAPAGDSAQSTTANSSATGDAQTTDEPAATPTPDPEPVAETPTYAGTDAEGIINNLCSQTGCHDASTVLAYKADAKVAQLRVDTHSTVEVELTDEQAQALVEYFTK